MKPGLCSFALFSLLALAGPLSAGVILTNNLTEPTTDFDTVSGSTWLAISFLTDNNTYTLGTATLLIDQAVGGVNTEELDLYNDASGPHTQLATFTNPATVGTTLANTTFTATGVALLPNTTYWVVLKALSGTFNWGWAGDNLGTGVGFTDTFASTATSGSTWSVLFHNGPFQAQVITTGASVPEPSTLWLILPGFLLLFAARRRIV